MEIAEALGAGIEIVPARPGGVDLAATFLREILRKSAVIAGRSTDPDFTVEDHQLDAAIRQLIAEPPDQVRELLAGIEPAGAGTTTPAPGPGER